MVLHWGYDGWWQEDLTHTALAPLPADEVLIPFRFWIPLPSFRRIWVWFPIALWTRIQPIPPKSQTLNRLCKLQAAAEDVLLKRAGVLPVFTRSVSAGARDCQHGSGTTERNADRLPLSSANVFTVAAGWRGNPTLPSVAAAVQGKQIYNEPFDTNGVATHRLAHPHVYTVSPSLQVTAMGLPDDGDWWGARLEVPRTAAQLDFVLSDSQDCLWDNNDKVMSGLQMEVRKKV